MGLDLHLDAEALQPLIAKVVEQVLANVGRDNALIGEKLAVGEAEAARLLSLNTHQLRDERLRGRVKASVGPGRRILYAREDLLEYLRSRRWEKEQN